MTPDQRRRLRAIVERELDSPGEPARLRAEVEDALGGAFEPAMRLLALQDEQHRSSFYVKSEHVWYRRFGFRMMRPLFLICIAAAVVFVLLREHADPTLTLGCFVLGAFSLYVVLQIFAWRWGRLDERRLVDIRDRYRQRLERLRDELAGGSR